MRRLVVLFCLCAGLAFPACGQPPEGIIQVHADRETGAINRDLAGVSLGGGATTYTNPVYAKPLKHMGVRYVRLETITADHRKLYDPATDTWDWTLLDAEIESIQASGAEIITNIFYTPRFLAFHDDERYFYSYPKDYDAWERYVEAIVRHVNVEKGHGIRYWEIGNEASGAHFFRAPMRDFWAYYASSARAVKRADPQALVGGIADNANYPVHYRDFFDAAEKSGAAIDFITFHWYASWARQPDPSPALYQRFARELKTLARQRLGHDVPVFLTEWNYVGEMPTSPQIKVGAYVAAAFYWMQEAPIDAAFLFRVQPYRDTLGSLFNGRGERGMVGRIFKMFTELPGRRVALAADAPGVAGLAARSGDSLAVLLSRFDADGGAADLARRLTISGHDFDGRYRLTLSCEDGGTAAHYGAVEPREDRFVTLRAGEPFTLDVKLAPYSVAFLKLEKAEP